MNDLQNLHKILNELAIYSKEALYSFISEIITYKITEITEKEDKSNHDELIHEEGPIPVIIFEKKAQLQSKMVQNDVRNLIILLLIVTFISNSQTISIGVWYIYATILITVVVFVDAWFSPKNDEMFVISIFLYQHFYSNFIT